jgi:hypothetical protein
MTKAGWNSLQILALLLLLVPLPLGYALGHPRAGRALLIAIVLLHAGELRVSIPLAKKRNLSTGTAVLETLLFGFTWWVPLKQGLLQG